MKNKKILKIGLILLAAGIVIAGGIGFYLFNLPHRDVQASKSDSSVTTTQIVAEYLKDKDRANKKYLASDGDSKILEVTGIVNKISEDFNGLKVVLLKSNEDKAGVSATFSSVTNANASSLHVGQKVTLKGVIRSGAAFDEDLGLYENVILEKSDLLTK